MKLLPFIAMLLASCGGAETATCSLDRQAMVERVAQVRGHHRLEWAGQLEAAAAAHAAELATIGKVDHTGRDGSVAADRAQRAGWPSRYVGENIAAGPSIETETEAMALWEASPGHLQNLQLRGYTHVGAACVVSGPTAYWVQVLAANQ